MLSRSSSRSVAALIASVGYATQALAQEAVEPAARILALSPGRVGALLSGVVALVGAVSGGRALLRPARRRAVLALVLAPLGLLGGALVVVTADGGLGTGNGLGGGVVAIVVGLLGVSLGGAALLRARRRARGEGAA